MNSAKGLPTQQSVPKSFHSSSRMQTLILRNTMYIGVIFCIQSGVFLQSSHILHPHVHLSRVFLCHSRRSDRRFMVRYIIPIIDSLINGHKPDKSQPRKIQNNHYLFDILLLWIVDIDICIHSRSNGK